MFHSICQIYNKINENNFFLCLVNSDNSVMLSFIVIVGKIRVLYKMLHVHTLWCKHTFSSIYLCIPIL